MLSVGVCELGQALPSVLEDVVLVWQQPLHGVLDRVFPRGVALEDELSLQEEADGPDPLRPLMVVDTMASI